MEQHGRKTAKRSGTKIIPPKKNVENLSRDEVRSINKKRIKRKRKIKKMMSLLALSSVVLCVGVLLVLTVFFKINTVNVTGAKIYANSKVMEESGIEIGSSLFSVSEKNLNEILPQKLPYVKSVKLTRKLPDTLVIDVTATRETAAFVYGSGYILVDDSGKVLDRDAKMLRENVAVVSGVALKGAPQGQKISLDNETVTGDLITILSEIKKSKFNGVTEIILKDNEFKLLYEDRITIKLGAMTNLDVKLQRAKAAIDKEDKINPYSEGVLDLKTEPYAYFRLGAEEEVTLPQVYVTDEEGNAVTDENGEYLTTEPSSDETSTTEAAAEE